VTRLYPDYAAGKFAKKAATWSRRNCFSNTAWSPRLPREPENTFFARSIPIVVISMRRPFGFEWLTALPLWHIDAAIGSGRPSHCYVCRVIACRFSIACAMSHGAPICPTGTRLFTRHRSRFVRFQITPYAKTKPSTAGRLFTSTDSLPVNTP
jgi:hypothetical protein